MRLIACKAPSHQTYMKQCSPIANWTLGNKNMSIIFYFKFKRFHGLKCIWEYRLQNGCHFLQASMCTGEGNICLTEGPQSRSLGYSWADVSYLLAHTYHYNFTNSMLKVLFEAILLYLHLSGLTLVGILTLKFKYHHFDENFVPGYTKSYIETSITSDENFVNMTFPKFKTQECQNWPQTMSWICRCHGQSIAIFSMWYYERKTYSAFFSQQLMLILTDFFCYVVLVWICRFPVSMPW